MQHTEDFNETQVFGYWNDPSIKIHTLDSDNQIVETYGGLSDELAEMLPKKECSHSSKDKKEQPCFKNYEYNYTEQVVIKDEL
jgi:hypothetical protein